MGVEFGNLFGIFLQIKKEIGLQKDGAKIQSRWTETGENLKIDGVGFLHPKTEALDSFQVS